MRRKGIGYKEACTQGAACKRSDEELEAFVSERVRKG